MVQSIGQVELIKLNQQESIWEVFFCWKLYCPVFLFKRDEVYVYIYQPFLRYHTRLLASVIFGVMYAQCVIAQEDSQDNQQDEVALGLYQHMTIGLMAIQTEAGRGRVASGLFDDSDTDSIIGYDAEKTNTTSLSPVTSIIGGYRVNENFSYIADFLGTAYVGVRYQNDSFGMIDLSANFLWKLLDSGSSEYRNPYALNQNRETADIVPWGFRLRYAMGPVHFQTVYTRHDFKNDGDDLTKSLTEVNTSSGATAAVTAGTFGREGDIIEYNIDVFLPVIDIGVGYTQANLEGRADSHSGPSGNIDIVVPLSEMVDLGLSLGGGVITYNQENPVFDQTRKDNSLSFSASVIYGNWTFLAAIEDSNSNIDFFDERQMILGFNYSLEKTIFESLADAF